MNYIVVGANKTSIKKKIDELINGDAGFNGTKYLRRNAAGVTYVGLLPSEGWFLNDNDNITLTDADFIVLASEVNKDALTDVRNAYLNREVKFPTIANKDLIVSEANKKKQILLQQLKDIEAEEVLELALSQLQLPSVVIEQHSISSNNQKRTVTIIIKGHFQ